jgi:phosphatidylethanolamine/phosphatidyl-N-methylethanolamine N-methyltransferase
MLPPFPYRSQSDHPGKNNGSWLASVNGTAKFCLQALAHPAQTGALAPSSRALAQAMAQHIPKHATSILELGAGTGSVTDEIIANGFPEASLTLVEYNPVFANMLRNKFPAAQVYQTCAQHLSDIVAKPVDAIVSSLPFRAFALPKQRMILEAALQFMNPRAPFIFFTYNHKHPFNKKMLDELQLVSERQEVIWKNLPPATVHVLRQQAR